ncbi:FMN-binding negative transcriptional regulator [Acinetobacter sp. NIPH 1852]|uniref:FMN-binding negative transcriptional regulator n=1 Tax=Acinetobacter sp. NIPH 1852 TaxID=2923428 RepID=UPI001F4AE6B7|nr:FMN-binding negative transcriptional regulator [Acinetobacter sp. NIPH 1852]MCH7307975.1 FMN-binding negative transcriptional regulator [Acinetobacter sp. NIPH 1852]
MFLPEIFVEKDLEKLYALIQDYPFATLISHSAEGVEANHLPFKLLLDKESDTAFLIAHIAKGNPLHTQIENNTDVLVIFQGEQGYISPNWYPTKQQHHQHVPTWNYQVVHIKGKINFLHDEKSLRGILAKLTRTHEAKQAKPWKMSDAPSEYIAEELKGIIGIEIQIEKITGKFKLSQNREKIDALGVVAGLEQQGEQGLAKAVQQYIED